MKKSFYFMLLIVLLSTFFSAGLSLSEAADEWRIGTIYPLSGPNSKNGIKNFDGVKIATDMVNETGGVLGKKVVLVSADAPDPQAAASEANRLITNERITAIIGTQSSSLSMAATVVAEKNKIFYIETEGVSGLIHGKGIQISFQDNIQQRDDGLSSGSIRWRNHCPQTR